MSERPLVFLDVDGTLLPFGAAGDYPEFAKMDRRLRGLAAQGASGE